MHAMDKSQRIRMDECHRRSAMLIVQLQTQIDRATSIYRPLLNQSVREVMAETSAMRTQSRDLLAASRRLMTQCWVREYFAWRGEEPIAEPPQASIPAAKPAAT
jgi:hypothetical protein